MFGYSTGHDAWAYEAQRASDFETVANVKIKGDDESLHCCQALFFFFSKVSVGNSIISFSNARRTPAGNFENFNVEIEIAKICA